MSQLWLIYPFGYLKMKGLRPFAKTGSFRSIKLFREGRFGYPGSFILETAILILLGLLAPAGEAAPPLTKTTASHQAESVYQKIYPSDIALQQVQTSFTTRVVAKQPEQTLAQQTARTAEQPNPLPDYSQLFLTPAQQVVKALEQAALQPAVQPAVQAPAQQPAQTSPPLTQQATDSQPHHAQQVDYPERSWVSDLTAPQAIPLAANIAGFLARQFNPETTTLLLATPDKKQLNNPLTPELEAKLHHAGFTLVTTHAEAPQAQLVQYRVNALNNGILVQLHTPNQWASRYYPLNATQTLMATHPFSIRTLGGIAP